MIVTIPDLLSPEKIEAVVTTLRQGRYIDGRLSAGDDANRGKNNLELAPDTGRYTALNDVVMTALVTHPTYLRAALPARIGAPIYARYRPGMEYAGHIDDPIMGAPSGRYRADLSISIFLSDPGDYQGGELSIDTTTGSQSFKLAAGSALIYPSTYYHAVKPVSEGERLVAVTWVQSHVRLAEQRAILQQLAEARDLLSSDTDSAAYRRVNLSYTNLFRLWAET